MRALGPIAMSCALLAAACAEAPPEAPLARREFQTFQREVYPVLLRDCGFPACHGAPERFFRVWGPGRVRLPGELKTPEAFDLPSANELSASRALALSMIDEREPLRSPLLRKPLAVQAGGSGHLGADKYGRDVYRTPEDEGLLVITKWVVSAPPAQTAPTAMPMPTP
jgi:hypothetical protein